MSAGGRGRCPDHVFAERLWRSVRCEGVSPRGYESVPDPGRGPRAYLGSHTTERLHQSLGYRTPAEVYGVRAGTG